MPDDPADTPRRPSFLFCSACGAGPFDVDGLADHLVGELADWDVDALGAMARLEAEQREAPGAMEAAENGPDT